jgi:hypothetical protein
VVGSGRIRDSGPWQHRITLTWVTTMARDSLLQLAGLVTLGIALGSIIGFGYAVYQHIPYFKVGLWWAVSIGTLMFSYGVWTLPGWGIWRGITAILAAVFIGLEFSQNPTLIDLTRQGNPVVYDHTLLGQGVGAVFGMIAALTFRRE